MTAAPLELAIVGGGISGIGLARALQDTPGLKVTVYERARAFGEIGAGVSFGPNAVAAMRACGVYEAFEKVATFNTSKDKADVWFDFTDAYAGDKPDYVETIDFTICNSLGQSGVHRARFLDEIVKLVPKEMARFGKVLEDVVEREDGKMVLKFADGTEATADAVIGCDGIKSRTRRVLFGPQHQATYTHKYAYRGLVDIDEASAVVGEEMGKNSFMHLGPNGHMLTFPVNHNKTLNIVAFRNDEGEWADPERLTKPGKRSDVLRDFEGWSPNVLKLLAMCDEELSIWAIFDLLENPVPRFNKGRACLVGDAAHATSPHHGAGAGFCLEDSAVLAALIKHAVGAGRTSPADVEAVFEAYDAARRERGQWLVESSRRTGNLFDFMAEGAGSDMRKIEPELRERCSKIFLGDVPKMCQDAVKDLEARFV